MYFITAMTSILTENTKFDSKEAKEHSTRCFGYYSDKEKAVLSVKQNTCDMWKTMYNYIVIEKIFEEGIHPYSEIVGWFKYNREKNEYEPIEVGHTGFSNYALG